MLTSYNPDFLGFLRVFAHIWARLQTLKHAQKRTKTASHYTRVTPNCTARSPDVPPLAHPERLVWGQSLSR